jgi:hypothetical protein
LEQSIKALRQKNRAPIIQCTNTTLPADSFGRQPALAPAQHVHRSTEPKELKRLQDYERALTDSNAHLQQLLRFAGGCGAPFAGGCGAPFAGGCGTPFAGGCGSSKPISTAHLLLLCFEYSDIFGCMIRHCK